MDFLYTFWVSTYIVEPFFVLAFNKRGLRSTYLKKVDKPMKGCNEMLSKIKQTAPVVHCITNYVVANFTANGLLAVGASPIMADEVNEVADVVSAAQGVLINIGTVNDRTMETMLVAGETANKLGVPVVLDPVGVGISAYRKQVIKRLLNSVKVDLIRCNAGELAAIAGKEWHQKGVDSGKGTMAIAKVAQEVALKYQCNVIVTGEIDYLTNGQEEQYVPGGKEMATRITGMGCLLSAICTASLASGKEDTFNRLTTTLQDYKRAAEQSGNEVGTFAVQFMSALQKIVEDEQ